MRRGRRQLSNNERSLWNTVASTVTPMNGGKPSSTPTKSSVPEAIAKRTTTAAKETPRTTRASPIDAGDPKRAQLVGRGRLPIDAVIDLHGMRQDEADRSTAAFIARGVQRGHRVLLIITGKGNKASNPGGSGVLRQRFLQRMEEGAYGPGIASVRPAHQRHGGRGAFYVLLKAPKRSTGRRETVTKGSRGTSMPR